MAAQDFQDPSYNAQSSDPGTAAAPAPPSPYKYAWQGTNQGQVLASRVAGAYQQYYGTSPSQADIWGRLDWNQMPDENFMQKILGDIQTQGQAYKAGQAAAQPAAPTTPTAPPPTTTDGGGSTGSPVTSTGQIAPTPPPTQVKIPSQPAAATLKPVDLSTVPQYQAASFANTAPQLNLPDQSGTNAQQNALLSAILQNPQTLSPTVLSQMKEQGKEGALSMEKQNQALLDQDAIARGVVGSGNSDALAQKNLQDALNSILTSNRNVDVTAAQTNRQDELNALTASSGVAQDQLNRALAGYNAGLSGAQFNLGVGQANAAEKYKAQQAALDQAMKQEGINESVAQNAQGNYQQQLAAAFGQNSANLDLSKYLEGIRQFNDTLGFNYNNLDQNAQLAVLQAILNGGSAA